MKPETTLTALSLTLIVLMAIHLSQDIVFGYDPSGPMNLTGIAILAVWLYAALVLMGRRSGYMILLVGSFMAMMMPVIHMSGHGVRAEVVESAGGLLFLWGLMALGCVGGVALVLSTQGLWRLERKVGSFLIWILVTVVATVALFGSLIYLRG